MWDQFVGLPYADKGRDFSGVDCWGLHFLINRTFGLDLPSYSDRYVTAADLAVIARLIGSEIDDDWREIPRGEERPLDGALMREGRLPGHIGTVVRPGLLIHIERGETSRIESYRVSPLKHRLVGFYRHRAHE